MDKIDKHYVGLAGEYLVAGMFSLKGWMANLTSKNCPSFDVFVHNPDNGKNANVQVKTLMSGKTFFMGITRHKLGEIEQKIKGPYVFVYLNADGSVRYFILLRKQVIDLVITTDNHYCNYKCGKPREVPITSDYLVGLTIGHLESANCEGNWDNLWE